MTDLTNMRDMADPYEAVEYPEGTGAAIKEYLQPKSFLRRGFYPALEPEPEGPVPSWEDMISGKADLEVDMPIAPAMLMPKALKAMRGLQKLKTQERLAGGWYREAAGALHKIESRDLNKVAKAIPQRLWDRVRSIKALRSERPGVMGRHVEAGASEADIFLNPAGFESGTAFHEIAGHEGSRLAKEVGKDIPNIRVFRNWWDATHDEMNSLQKWLRRVGADRATVRKVYKFSPDELFSRAVSERMESGVGFVDSVIEGYSRVHANKGKTLSALREGLEAARKIQESKGMRLDVDVIMRRFSSSKAFGK